MQEQEVGASMGAGVGIFRASRLEALLDPLTTMMAEGRPTDVLAPHTVVAAHPGIKQWLTRELARRNGQGGIVANLEVSLPSAWLDRLAQQVLGESAVALASYRRENLRWRIHACLDAMDDAQIRAYLSGSDVPRRRFQLADRLARIYTRYLVYRPDWLQAWAAGRTDLPESTFLAPLWKHLREQIDLPHRGELLLSLARVLRSDAELDLPSEPLHVFGVSHLAPSEMAMLQAVARRRLVVLYVPDPCVEYWAGLRPEEQRLRELVKLDVLPDDVEEAFLEQGHPLLASWGRMGQHLMLGLSDAADVVVDMRHWGDDEHAQPGHALNRLHSVQESLRRLDPRLIQPGRCGDPAAQEDRSLRVHACHTRLRELEVLRDALLMERSKDPGLKPSQIVVMAPDIQAYVPLLGAVFGEAGAHGGPLPYHLADVAVSRSHPLFTAFETLLALPQSRLTAPEVMDLLEVPEIARALNLDESGIEVLHAWLQRSRVAWALDGDYRAAFGVPAIEQHTFAWGMDRLLGGYVFGDSGDGERVAQVIDGVAMMPIEGIHGPQAEVIGALDKLLQLLAEWHRDTALEQPASAWSERLARLITSIFRIDFMDAPAREALQQLQRFTRIIDVDVDTDSSSATTPAEQAVKDPLLAFSVVREVLLERLSAAPERQRFLMGGITFCGMVPQRAIPFEVIAVLGLNDGEFPRVASDGGLDLMARYPRIGDRDVRNDDRYLFLETVMSARRALHLSYLGEGVRDGKLRNPSTPLAELLNAFEQTVDPRTLAADNGSDRPWLIRHPLQPFDARYFDASDARLFSFRRDLAELANEGARQDKPFFLFRPTQAALAQESAVVVALPQVLGYFKDPARQVLQDRLHLRLDALADDSLRSSEPLADKLDAIERIPRRIFIEVVSAVPASATALPGVADRRFQIPEQAPDWLRLDGLLPPGRIGDTAWQNLRERVADVLAANSECAMLARPLPDATPVAIEQRFGPFQLKGEIRRAYQSHDTLWLFDALPDKKNEAELSFRELLPFFFEWALLRLADPRGSSPVRVALLTRSNNNPWQSRLNDWDAAFVEACREADSARARAMLQSLEQRVLGLLELWSRSQTSPVLYFPRTSWKILKAEPGQHAEVIQDAWSGERGELSYSAHASVLARDVDFDDDADNSHLTQLLDTAQTLYGLITLDVDGDDAGERTDD